jgi:hypothetical protein
VGVGDAAGDGQPDPAAAAGGVSAGPVEPFEDAAELVGGQADAGVRDGDPARCLGLPAGDVDPAAGGV